MRSVPHLIIIIIITIIITIIIIIIMIIIVTNHTRTSPSPAHFLALQLKLLATKHTIHEMVAMSYTVYI